ncbi:MAG: hypothetical protein DME23_13090 [Verrucomicrobia bacterium]|nr:MAG: hypothetical protein DME23_13090 [Verrucomicrobiota bacterium]
MFVGAMSPTFSAAGAEFLQHYARDAQIRWSLEDLAAQREFVNPSARMKNMTRLCWPAPSSN